ncbi:hypothetical protein EPUS_07898 [Endocarpon pusillum Z07020]|uniref:Uncharacterized protein n=1 Tax=Endocarpon pusillum (strain Z07020 / HMAS-L-300199) TaxID=1263415 RepID=U1HLR8_ENDPU|nr:uncharacterized protein EPUS_07898 [Endocarpon pusillum Z07020]ERF71215.1 hypothetical protein EPUS_07898 [Endocarpon pusillum Z07020]
MLIARAGQADINSVKERAKTILNRLKNASTLVASALPNLHTSSSKRARPLAAGSGPDLSGIEASLTLLTQAIQVQTEVAAQAANIELPVWRDQTEGWEEETNPPELNAAAAAAAPSAAAPPATASASASEDENKDKNKNKDKDRDKE